MSFFDDLFSNDPAKDAAMVGSAIRKRGLEKSTDVLNTGYGEASKYLDTAIARFDPLAATANQGFDAYAQLYGVGGGDPAAMVRAMPGYQFSQDEAAEATKRQQASTGFLGSTNTLQMIADRSANIADTKWQQYAEGLKPFLSLAPQIAGQQGAYSAGQAGQQTDLASQIAKYQMGTSAANADAYASAELARSSAAKNVFDAIMGGVKLATGAVTGGLGGAGGFTSFFGGNPSSASYGSNPFGTSGQINPAYYY